MSTIGDRQAEFDRWYAEWMNWGTGAWQQKTPESLLDYFKTRLCVTLGPLPVNDGQPRDVDGVLIPPYA